jgi:hypothetical protein
MPSPPFIYTAAALITKQTEVCLLVRLASLVAALLTLHYGHYRYHRSQRQEDFDYITLQYDDLTLFGDRSQ